MRLVLREPINIDGLTWPAGELEVTDPYWSRALRAAGAVVLPDETYLHPAAASAAEVAASPDASPDAAAAAPVGTTAALTQPRSRRRRVTPQVEE